MNRGQGRKGRVHRREFNDVRDLHVYLHGAVVDGENGMTLEYDSRKPDSSIVVGRCLRCNRIVENPEIFATHVFSHIPLPSEHMMNLTAHLNQMNMPRGG